MTTVIFADAPRRVRSLAMLLAILAAHALVLWAALPSLRVSAPSLPVIPVLTRLLPRPPPPPPDLSARAPKVNLQVRSPLPPVVPLIHIDVPSVPEEPVVPARLTGPLSAPAAGPPQHTAMTNTYKPDSDAYYPQLAQELHQQGVALTEVCIAADGHIESVRLLKSTYIQRLDLAALTVARLTRWAPATLDHKSLSGCQPFRVSFVLRSN